MKYFSVFLLLSWSQNIRPSKKSSICLVGITDTVRVHLMGSGRQKLIRILLTHLRYSKIDICISKSEEIQQKALFPRSIKFWSYNFHLHHIHAMNISLFLVVILMTIPSKSKISTKSKSKNSVSQNIRILYKSSICLVTCLFRNSRNKNVVKGL